MRSPLCKHLLCWRAFSSHVQLAQQVNQRNVQYIAGAPQ